VTVHFVVPEGVDDALRPSGGNVYDRRLGEELRAAGWEVREHQVTGQLELAVVLAELPDRATVLVDGLVASVTEAMVGEAARLRIVVLLHMPLAEAVGEARVATVERAVLGAADAVVTTSQWARRWVIVHHGLAPQRVRVALPGVDRGPQVAGSTAGGHLLCVGPVTADKGHDVLLDALCQVKDLEWRCTCVGALDLDPAFVDRLTATARRAGVAERVTFAGPVTQTGLEELRSATDLVVSASRRESFGMAVTEGLARGIPVFATEVGGHPEAVGRAADGSIPGLLVPPGDAGGLAHALRRWLTDTELRTRLRRAAAGRRTGLTTWANTARIVSSVLNRAPLVSVSLTSEHRTDG